MKSDSPIAAFVRIVAAAAALAVVLISGFSATLLDSGWGGVLELLVGLGVGVLAIAIGAGLARIALIPVRAAPVGSLALALGAFMGLWFLRENRPGAILRTLTGGDGDLWPGMPGAYSLPAFTLVVCTIALLIGLLLGARSGLLAALARWQRLALFTVSGVFLLLSAGIVMRLAGTGHDPYPLDGAAPEVLPIASPLKDPGQPGPFAIEKRFYGAGPNPRRREFDSARDLESRTVDARKLLPEWKDYKQQMRERYWGYGLAEAPLNGTVWAPVGDGPYPLVLIVHGNHGMEDYSDGGYAYLGELLASQGFITVSVDQNYINGTWSGDFQGKEMAARGWLLLEHLALWRDWNTQPGHAFAGRVDLENIALIGHSRGGEAVSIAQAFNKLQRFPDDATVTFDYDFNIRSLIAIAQVDQRYDRRLQLEDVNFFTIHGSYDSDEPAYHGLRQMNRIQFSGQGSFIKAGVYLHGANHGQFNTGWGRYDTSAPDSWTLNTAPMIPPDEQRQAAKAYIAAFLAATLQGKSEYLALLKDPRVGASWLPSRTLVAQFTDSSFAPLADFEEDIDVATATVPGGSIAGRGLSLWRETSLLHRDKRLQGSNALLVGWREPGADISIDLAVPQDLAGRALVFSVSGASADAPVDAADGSPPLIPGFSVELVDSTGRGSSVNVTDYAQLIPPVRVQYLKNPSQNKRQYYAVWEPVLQSIEIPLSAFRDATPASDDAMQRTLDLRSIETLRLRFDQTAEGGLIFDHIGTVAIP